MELENILKALADETRLRVLNILKDGKLCCREIQYTLGDVKQSNLSRHMAKLSEAGLVEKEKQAQWINYGLNGEMLDKYGFIFNMIKDEFAKSEIFVNDSQKLKEYKKKNLGCEEQDYIGGCDEIH